jgi:hypothetical protein
MSENNNLKKIFDSLYEEKYKLENKIKELDKIKRNPVTNDCEGNVYRAKTEALYEENIKFHNTVDSIIGTVISLIN